MRLLDAAKIKYEVKEYPVDENDLSGSHAADLLGVDHGSVFKTLVLKGERTGYLVCCIPVDGEVDLKKAAKAAHYAKTTGTAYVKAISACPLNWNDKPATERKVIEAAVNCCYFPLYEVEQGVTRLSYDPEKLGKKIPVLDWLSMMGRTKHLQKEEYREVVERLQQETDKRFQKLKSWQN